MEHEINDTTTTENKLWRSKKRQSLVTYVISRIWFFSLISGLDTSCSISLQLDGMPKICEEEKKKKLEPWIDHKTVFDGIRNPKRLEIEWKRDILLSWDLVFVIGLDFSFFHLFLRYYLLFFRREVETYDDVKLSW